MEIVTIDEINLAQHPGAICFINPKNPSFPLKIEWIKQRFSEGLRIKLLYTDDKKKVAGFIEYLPGEFAWRQFRLLVICLFTVFGFIRMKTKTKVWEHD